jgi:hypothetical protein
MSYCHYKSHINAAEGADLVLQALDLPRREFRQAGIVGVVHEIVCKERTASGQEAIRGK